MKRIKFTKEKRNNYSLSFMNIRKNKLIYLFLFLVFFTILLIFIFSFKERKININKNESLSDIELLKMLTNNNPDLYSGFERCLGKDPDEEMCIYKYICPKEVKGKKRILMGTKGDGVYVMLMILKI